jgi:transposase
MRAFPTATHLASWAGVCPGNDESAGKRRSGKTRKGSKWLRHDLAECAKAVPQQEHVPRRPVRPTIPNAATADSRPTERRPAGAGPSRARSWVALARPAERPSVKRLAA